MAELARQQHLSDEDDVSDDELELTDQWEWIYGDDGNGAVGSSSAARSSKKRKATGALLSAELRNNIIGARMGDHEYRVGDIILLKSERNEDWLGLLYEFGEDEMEGEKTATFMWFSSPNEIVNKTKRKTDTYPNEMYITTDMDVNPLDAINGKATVISPQKFMEKYPSGQPPKKLKNKEKVFVCRMGCSVRTATYTKEFVWEDIFQGRDDVENLKERVRNETKATRKRKTLSKDLDNFVAPDDDDKENYPRTPSKRRKLDVQSASRSTKQTPNKFTTPTHRRVITKKPLEYTPLGTRVLSPAHTTSSPFQIARSQLHVSSVPSSLPCREEEFSSVYSYLESAITDGTGSCIYISGTPGTGKTATVREVIAQLHASVQADELDDFIFVEINGMKVTDPHQSYALLWEALTGDRLSPTHALSLLEREFSSPSPRRVPCVVLMDELDQLVTKNQSVMYNFFNWPNLRHSRLIVLAVANTMDLPERTLSNKISSRLGLTRITFPGYTHDQLIKIVQSRLEGAPGKVVDADAVQFASRKVAQVSGDARRALDICRRAVEIAESEAAGAAGTSQDANPDPETPSKRGRGKEQKANDADSKRRPPGHVTIATVQKAIREATASPLQQYLRHLPLASKVFLAALLARARRTGIAECILADVVVEAKRLSAMSEVPEIGDFLLCLEGEGKVRAPRVLAMGDAVMELVGSGVVAVEARRGERTGKVRLSVGEEEIKGALREDVEVKGLGFAT